MNSRHLTGLRVDQRSSRHCTSPFFQFSLVLEFPCPRTRLPKFKWKQMDQCHRFAGKIEQRIMETVRILFPRNLVFFCFFLIQKFPVSQSSNCFEFSPTFMHRFHWITQMTFFFGFVIFCLFYFLVYPNIHTQVIFANFFGFNKKSEIFFLQITDDDCDRQMAEWFAEIH